MRATNFGFVMGIETVNASVFEDEKCYTRPDANQKCPDRTKKKKWFL